MDSLRVCRAFPTTHNNMASKKANRMARPKRVTIRGRGDYSADVLEIQNPISRLEKKIDHLEKSLVKNPLSKANAASTIGRTLGNFANQGDLGAMAGSALAKYFGHGDYQVKTNSLMTGAPTGAKFSNDGRRGTRIIEREYLGDILSGTLMGGATEFDLSSYDLNPTDPATFPWLSQLAHLYDQWEPNGIVFEFVSTSSEYNGASQALGTVVMATDYDPYDAPYPTKQLMENSDYSCSTKPANGLVHGIECAVRERPTPLLYTSTDNGAPKTAYSLGNFQLATQGCSVGGVNLGELWVSYDITFYKKQMAGVSGSQLPFLSATGTNPGNAPWFSTTTSLSNRQITLTQIVGTGSQLDFHNINAGTQFQVEFYTTQGDVVSDPVLIGSWTFSGCTATTRQSTTIASGQFLRTWTVTTTAPNAYILTNLRVYPSAWALGASLVSPTYTF